MCCMPFGHRDRRIGACRLLLMRALAGNIVRFHRYAPPAQGSAAWPVVSLQSLSWLLLSSGGGTISSCAAQSPGAPPDGPLTAMPHVTLHCSCCSVRTHIYIYTYMYIERHIYVYIVL